MTLQAGKIPYSDIGISQEEFTNGCKILYNIFYKAILIQGNSNILQTIKHINFINEH